MEINDITGEIVRASMRVHSALGPGLLEATYRVCVRHELQSRGLQLRKSVRFPSSIVMCKSKQVIEWTCSSKMR